MKLNASKNNTKIYYVIYFLLISYYKKSLKNTYLSLVFELHYLSH